MKARMKDFKLTPKKKPSLSKKYINRHNEDDKVVLYVEISKHEDLILKNLINELNVDYPHKLFNFTKRKLIRALIKLSKDLNRNKIIKNSI